VQVRAAGLPALPNTGSNESIASQIDYLGWSAPYSHIAALHDQRGEVFWRRERRPVQNGYCERTKRTVAKERENHMCGQLTNNSKTRNEGSTSRSVGKSLETENCKLQNHNTEIARARTISQSVAKELCKMITFAMVLAFAH